MRDIRLDVKGDLMDKLLDMAVKEAGDIVKGFMLGAESSNDPDVEIPVQVTVDFSSPFSPPQGDTIVSIEEVE